METVGRGILRQIYRRLSSQNQTFLNILARVAGRDVRGAHGDSAWAGKVLRWRHPATGGGGSSRPLLQVRERMAAFAAELEAVPTLLPKLLALVRQGSLDAVTDDERFHSLALCQAVLESSRELTFEEPKLGIRIAEAGVHLAKSLDSSLYGEHLVRDVCGRAWAELGNAYRVGSDLIKAERCLTKASACLYDSCDPLEKARFFNIAAVLKKDQRRFHEALRLRERAIKIYRSFGEDHFLCLSLCSKGSDLLEMGEPEAATRALDEAVMLVNPLVEPRVSLAAHHNLATALVFQGRYLEAAEAHAKLKHLYRDETWSKPRDEWLRGRIAVGLGRLEEAEKAFTAARKSFQIHEVPYDFALVSIELALVHARKGETVKVKKLAAEMVPIFKSRNIHREALAALTLFRQAAEQEAATVGALQEIFERLQKAPRRV